MYLLILAAVAVAGANTESDVNYMWRTGQQAKAIELIADAYEADPTDLTNVRLHIASQVHNGDGATLELNFREAFDADNNDLRRRLALATLLAYRNAEKGDWCDDAEALLKPIGDTDEALHIAAVQARVLAHTRCEVSTDVDQGHWVKIIKSGVLGSEEKAAYAVGGGYAGEDLADSIKLALAKSPRHVEFMVPLWDSETGGPGLLMAQKAAIKGAKNAMATGDPQAAAAAYWFYKGTDNERGYIKALDIWKSLDADANYQFSGAIADISDPKIYKRLSKAGTDLAALDALADKIPKDGDLAAYYQHLRAEALDEADDGAAAFAAAKAAYELAPDVILFAEKFAQAAAGHQKNLPLALTAIETAMTYPQSRRNVVRLFIRSKIYTALERYPEAEADLLGLFEQKPTSRLYHRSLANLYRTMDDNESAIVHYMAAMQDPDAEAPAEKSIERGDRLMASDADWVAGPKKLKGKPFPIDIGDASKVTAVVVGASWSAPTKAALGDLADLVDSHGTKGFRAVAVFVDRNEPEMASLTKANEKLTLIFGGAMAAREARIVSVPTIYVLDEKNRVLDAFHDGG